MFSLTKAQTKAELEALFRLQKVILSSLDYNTVITEVVDSVFKELNFLKYGYEIVVLSLIDEKDQTLKRISVSKTEKAKEALRVIPIPFNQIVIPLSCEKNLMIKALRTKEPQVCTEWPDILMPSFTKEDALQVQHRLGIKTSVVYPIIAQEKPLGTMIFSMNKPLRKMTSIERTIIAGLANTVGLAVQNSMLYSRVESTKEKLKKANEHLKHLDELKDEFVFIATHELKNPVTAMRGYLSMMNEGIFGPVPESMHDAVQQLTLSNQQLVDLVNDLLQIARSEAKTLKIVTEPVDLNKLIDDVLQADKPLAEEKNLMLIHGATQPMTVTADAQKLKEVVQNLVSNAIKYSMKGTIKITHEIKTDEIVTHVTDQGLGISEDDQKKLFTRFFRADAVQVDGIPGTGLGLFIVKQLVEKMGGKIWVSSALGVGTTFSFSLPRLG